MRLADVSQTPSPEPSASSAKLEFRIVPVDATTMASREAILCNSQSVQRGLESMQLPVFMRLVSEEVPFDLRQIRDKRAGAETEALLGQHPEVFLQKGGRTYTLCSQQPSAVLLSHDVRALNDAAAMIERHMSLPMDLEPPTQQQVIAARALAKEEPQSFDHFDSRAVFTPLRLTREILANLSSDHRALLAASSDVSDLNAWPECSVALLDLTECTGLSVDLLRSLIRSATLRLVSVVAVENLPELFKNLDHDERSAFFSKCVWDDESPLPSSKVSFPFLSLGCNSDNRLLPLLPSPSSLSLSRSLCGTTASWC